MAARVADAMRRGALCRDTVADSDSVDFLRVDWFARADLPVGEVRQRYNVTAKSADAVAAGSCGPWEAGGISPFQVASGRAAATRGGYAYDAFGAESSA